MYRTHIIADVNSPRDDYVRVENLCLIQRMLKEEGIQASLSRIKVVMDRVLKDPRFVPTVSCANNIVAGVVRYDLIQELQENKLWVGLMNDYEFGLGLHDNKYNRVKVGPLPAKIRQKYTPTWTQLT
jgi:hypothetical protein